MVRSNYNILNAGRAFSLIELLVVMAVISVLTAIAIPQYSDYRKRAFDMRAREDLRTVAIAEEAYFMDSEQYLSCEGAACSQLPGVNRLSDGTVLAVEAAETSFVGRSSHPQGSGREFVWDSEGGGLLP